MEHAVAFMAGTSYLILGASLIFRWQDWSVWVKRLQEQGRTAGLSIGMLHLVVGTFIVAFHSQWTGLPLLLTLIGVKAILEGMVYTLCPGFMIAMLKWLEPYHRPVFPLSGLIALGLSLVFLGEWQAAVFAP